MVYYCPGFLLPDFKNKRFRKSDPRKWFLSGKNKTKQNKKTKMKRKKNGTNKKNLNQVLVPAMEHARKYHAEQLLAAHLKLTQNPGDPATQEFGWTYLQSLCKEYEVCDFQTLPTSSGHSFEFTQDNKKWVATKLTNSPMQVNRKVADIQIIIALAPEIVKIREDNPVNRLYFLYRQFCLDASAKYGCSLTIVEFLPIPDYYLEINFELDGMPVHFLKGTKSEHVGLCYPAADFETTGRAYKQYLAA